MPLYEYHCSVCGKSYEILSELSRRNASKPCPVGHGLMPRKLTSPNIFMERAGCVEGRDDEFWNRAEKVQEKNLAKRQSVEAEKLRFGDKETLKKLETTHANLSRQGEYDKAEGVARKMDVAK